MLKHFLIATALPLPVSFAATTTPYAPLPSRLECNGEVVCGGLVGRWVGWVAARLIDRPTDGWRGGDMTRISPVQPTHTHIKTHRVTS